MKGSKLGLNDKDEKPEQNSQGKMVHYHYIFNVQILRIWRYTLADPSSSNVFKLQVGSIVRTIQTIQNYLKSRLKFGAIL
jgi:hypothetical protein